MATVRLWQGTEDFFVVTCLNDDGTPIQFDDCTVTFCVYDWQMNQIFSKQGTLVGPNPDIVLNNNNGEIELWLRPVDTAAVSDFTRWLYYVELEPTGSGPYPLDSGTIVVRPRLLTANQTPLPGYTAEDMPDRW